MEFTLYYRGDLKANRGPKDKHQLRQHFQKQLSELWHQAPLSELHEDLLEPDKKESALAPGGSLIHSMGDFQFAPLVCSFLSMVASLRITLLRPEPPGRIITQAGDIDNRLKTLLDGLTMPPHPEALPKGAKPSDDEEPFFCLLEDDNLIAGLSVNSERLLEPDARPSEVVLLVHVQTRPVGVTWQNIALL